MGIRKKVKYNFLNLLNRLRREKLVLTILVKDEIDIIVDNIFYHLAHGVDKVIVTDNGSNDGTLEVLKSLDEEGLIYLIQEKEYHQTKWVNNMGILARDKFKATIIIHTDADEFWHPILNNSLKNTFISLNKKAALIERYNIIPDKDSVDEIFPQKIMKIIKNRIATTDLQTDSKKTSMYLFRQSPKIIFSVKDKMRLVRKGNHQLAEETISDTTDSIEIYHFPFKSAMRFTEKVTRAIDSINVEEIKKNKNVSWHWKRWSKLYQEGNLRKEINHLIPDLSEFKEIGYRNFNYRKNIVKPIENNSELRNTYFKYKKIAKTFENKTN